ncbi:hypothetical protein ACFOY2_48585 [Nonomuraea purpurea]|uniref:Phage baseplate protein n=1 Tax=Nonomuraea purpurea TaxID=1849276 RepID=A0ABV8GS42_9ACTN
MTVPAGAAELLDAWETGWDRTPLERGLALLSAGTGRPSAELARLTIGQRDRALFELRAALFGSGLDGVSTCPECGTDVEVSFDQGQLLGPPSPAPYRLPTSADVAAALSDPDPCGALVDGCSKGAGAEETAASWAQADPLLDVELCLSCPDCGHEWAESFDIVSYLWSELDGWCRRTLLEVHDLATAYGWNEPQVLALSPWRRQCYLGLVRS